MRSAGCQSKEKTFRMLVAFGLIFTIVMYKCDRCMARSVLPFIKKELSTGVEESVELIKVVEWS